jgi:hypothetical protein
MEGRRYPLNVLLRLLRIWKDDAIDHVDELEPKDPQDWWLKACALYPSETSRAMEHVRHCEDVGVKSPY